MNDIKIKLQNRHSLALKVTPNGVEVLIPTSCSWDSKSPTGSSMSAN
jgi:hypothetical protein